MVKWKEDGKPKQVDIAKKSNKNVDIKMRKPFFPNPVLFNAVEKDSGKAATLQGRKELDVYPRKEKVVEKIQIRKCFSQNYDFYYRDRQLSYFQISFSMSFIVISADN